MMMKSLVKMRQIEEVKEEHLRMCTRNVVMTSLLPTRLGRSHAMAIERSERYRIAGNR